MNDVPGAADDRAAYAGFWRRFAAYAIDYLLVLHRRAACSPRPHESRAWSAKSDATAIHALVLAGYFLYCALLESSPWQATVGKRVLGIKVTNLPRRAHRLRARGGAFRREAAVGAHAVSRLFCLIVVTRRRQALHDLIAGTFVAHDGTPRRPAWVVAAFATVACVPLLGRARGDRAARVSGLRDPRASQRGALARERAIATRSRRRGASSPRDFADLTSDSIAAGLPRSGRYVESIEVVSGMIVITYGAAANDVLAGSVLTLVPALDAEQSLGWACGYGPTAAGVRSRVRRTLPATRPSSNTTFHRCAASTAP